MSLDLPHLIESTADTLGDIVHDWSHEARAFVNDHAPALPARRSSRPSAWWVVLPILVLGAVTFVALRSRRSRSTTTARPERVIEHDDVVVRPMTAAAS